MEYFLMAISFCFFGDLQPARSTTSHSTASDYILWWPGSCLWWCAFQQGEVLVLDSSNSFSWGVRRGVSSNIVTVCSFLAICNHHLESHRDMRLYCSDDKSHSIAGKGVYVLGWEERHSMII
jgi:hypothetical protein